MKAKILLLSVVLLIFCSCKKTIVEKGKTVINPDIKLEDVFSLTLNLKILFDDELKVYYTEDNSYNFNEEMTVRAKIRGIDSKQDIVFKFPNNIHPTNIRIDFGYNKNQRIIKLDTFYLGYNDDKLSIPPSSLLKYFNLIEDQLNYNTQTYDLEFIQDSSRDNYLPIIWSNDSLSSLIKKIRQF